MDDVQGPLYRSIGILRDMLNSRRVDDRGCMRMQRTKTNKLLSHQATDSTSYNDMMAKKIKYCSDIAFQNYLRKLHPGFHSFGLLIVLGRAAGRTIAMDYYDVNILGSFDCYLQASLPSKSPEWRQERNRQDSTEEDALALLAPSVLYSMPVQGDCARRAHCSSPFP